MKKTPVSLPIFSLTLALAGVPSLASASEITGATGPTGVPCARETSEDLVIVNTAARDAIRAAKAVGASGPTGSHVEVPPGLKAEEARKLWHLSEGSDIFPYAWMLHLKSATSSEKGTPFLQDLDKKFGMIRDTSPGEYPLPWVGLGGAWSDAPPVPKPGQKPESELVLSPGQDPKDLEMMRSLHDGKKSIGMVGVNCTLCHTGQITANGKTHIIDGAPAMVSLREFFQDMAGSLAETMLKEDKLEQFLKDMHYAGDAKKEAKRFSSELSKQLGLDKLDLAKRVPELAVAAYKDPDKRSLEGALKPVVMEAFFKHREEMADHMIELLQKTYGFKSKDEVPQTLKLRMKWLATLLGADPSLPTTPEGFNRTDAFGRIANWVARRDHPIPLTATTSLPSIYGIKYRSLFHWNANTNSVVMRNIGQSFGLGAILTNPDAPAGDPSKYDSTTNLHNLHEIEHLVYKAPIPNWTDYFGEPSPASKQAAMRGCATYQRTCAQCHEPKAQRVGPRNALIDYKVIPLAEIGTDPTHTRNQAVPVGDMAFRDALFGFAGKVRNRYYERYGISPEEQRQWEGRDKRGEEVFRDTVLGQPVFPKDHELSYVNTPVNSGYPARHLSGVWASPPYLHNGSVPNMWELLQPAKERTQLFFVGSTWYDASVLGFDSHVSSIADYDQFRAEYAKSQNGKISEEGLIHAACKKFESRCFDAKRTGNANVGHEGELYGTNLKDDEKRDLIEFLKVLAPEPEYSWKKKPLYHVENGECRLD